ncbi:ATP phosphoribosyltransferase regulatory subunit [Hyphomicrobium sp. CS1BSMeth3]|uniref:ATP phosphoribosyltransferase regulatory subunit n=1 Tax=Hyphomicrobium sp. CS1BSMeth3 TaxID=1892844 RepID=UPI000869D6F4|nr:ATP phosphoribosyltransferase regulatory subunit [Hyphomicrobium sp. CS1BSMeth3]ODT30361.1 MAG: ATP phosphoribosyltransferase regulatory subunit [Hyphomicrobium sp. SCN 65-11]
MAVETSDSFEALEAQAAVIMAVFNEAAYERVAPSIIQPADIFLDVVGERLRARTYVFTDQDGEMLCLRPDLTVPTARIYLQRHPDADVAARYCYNGSVFRYQPGGGSPAHPREFRQAGIELYAQIDEAKADAEVLLRTLEAVKAAGLKAPKLRIGDLGLFDALLDAVDIPERWRHRLIAQFWRPEAFRAELKRLSTVPGSAIEGLPADLIAKLDPAAPAKAEALVQDYLDSNAIEAIGTRAVSEIAGRLLSIAEDAHSAPLPKSIADLIENYLSISAPVRAAGARIKDLFQRNDIDIGEALDAFERRLSLLTKGGANIAQATFDAEFGRQFEYYTGFVFEICSEELGPASPIAGGGRYDELLRVIGAPEAIPAVGAAIYTDRLLLAAGGGTP